MDETFEMYRSERKSIFCSNRLWEELRKRVKDKTSISQFIKQAVLEKLVREAPEKKDYFESLCFLDFPK